MKWTRVFLLLLFLGASTLLLFGKKGVFAHSDLKRQFEILDAKKTHFWKKFTREDKKLLKRIKVLYFKNFPFVSASTQNTKIPRVIHFIWVGPKAFPETSKAFVQSWIEYHPGWVVKFWTDDPLRDAPCVECEKHLITELSLNDIEPYYSLTNNFGEKSDILRYEILSQEGGIYVDHDIECLHSFEPLIGSVHFFAGMEPPHRNKGLLNRIFPCNALIGAKPKHPIMVQALSYTKQRWKEVDEQFPGEDPQSRMLRVMHRSFHSFSLATSDYLGKTGYKDLILPASYFYADPFVTKEQYEEWKKQGVIWASHKCVGAWRPVAETPPL